MYKNTLKFMSGYSYRQILQKNNTQFIEKHILRCQFASISQSNSNATTYKNVSAEKFLNSNTRLLYLCAYISSSPASFGCWCCGKTIAKGPDAIFCEHCNSIQKPNPNNNYFQIIGIPDSYDVDEVILASKYKDLQRILHPDKFSNKNEGEQRISEEYSSLVNKAYSVLLQPMSRGIYMLQLKGLEIPEKTEVESAFLNEIMERNEGVENADTPEEVIRINLENKDIIFLLTGQISEAFKRGETDTVMKLLIRMKYFVSIDTQIKALIRKMGIVE